MVLHEQCWLLLTDTNPDQERVHSELVYSFFRLMLDPANMGVKKLAQVLDECLGNVRKEKGIEATDQENVECKNNFPLLYLNNHLSFKMNWNLGPE